MKTAFSILFALPAFASVAAGIYTVPMLVDDDFRGAWEATVKADGDFTARIYDPSSKLVAGPVTVETFQIAGVSPWTAENPVVYTLEVESAGGTEKIEFGFMTRQIGRRGLYVNGRRVRLKFGPKELNGNAAVAGGAVSDAEALRKGIYLVKPGELRELDFELPPEEPGAMKHFFQDWSILPADGRQRFAVVNRNAFTGSSGLELGWTLMRDGVKETGGRMDILSVPPGKTSFRDMPGEVFNALYREGSVAVGFEILKDGEPIAYDQIEMMQSRDSSPIGGEGGRVSFSEDPSRLEFKAGGTVFRHSKSGGFCVSFAKNGFFRETAAVENIFPCRLGRPVAGAAMPFPVSSVSESGGALSFRSCFTSGGTAGSGSSGGETSASWNVYPNGRVAADFIFADAGEGRSGIGFVLAGTPGKVEWYGLGPWSTSPGLTEGAVSGRWKADVVDGMTFEEVRGIKIGDFTVRTLGRPFATAILSRGGRTVLVVFAHGRRLSLSLSASDDGLTALSK